MPERNKKDRELSDDKLKSQETRNEVRDLEGATGIGGILGGTLRNEDEENEHEEDRVAEEVRQQREAEEQ